VPLPHALPAPTSAFYHFPFHIPSWRPPHHHRFLSSQRFLHSDGRLVPPLPPPRPPAKPPGVHGLLLPVTPPVAHRAGQNGPGQAEGGMPRLRAPPAWPQRTAEPHAQPHSGFCRAGWAVCLPSVLQPLLAHHLQLHVSNSVIPEPTQADLTAWTWLLAQAYGCMQEHSWYNMSVNVSLIQRLCAGDGAELFQRRFLVPTCLSSFFPT